MHSAQREIQTTAVVTLVSLMVVGSTIVGSRLGASSFDFGLSDGPALPTKLVEEFEPLT